ncbi:hypothetical protein PAAG_05875 [Paracoccidioides lutzii Pb01]|uniref:Uncharacterized protein n=1 Tax=Paracoccidioides lutzii (strain ATCC MYA-826 / Pb01) TaxID=502779 RepID=C1H534_PARBA|nr:hypothetical protein PAAG_05875 [Paracoccidioides lutzii Pb01]EEH34828.2 hypothetical protein PAAG_05875 [Paracoccidioides lutzii Pb01]
MATKKDMRRPDLVVPYVEPPEKRQDADMNSTVSSTMPMAAMFTKNKMIAWASVTFSLQSWMAETPQQRKKASTPGYMASWPSLSYVYPPVAFRPLVFQIGKIDFVYSSESGWWAKIFANESSSDISAPIFASPGEHRNENGSSPSRSILLTNTP